MSLLERVSQEIKAAMLSKNSERLGTLRLLKSALGYAQMEKKSDTLSDADAIAVLQREVKKCRESAEQFTKGGRQDLAGKELSELQVLETFLPQPFSPTELEELVRKVIADSGATTKKEMGAVIKAVQVQAAGRADGRKISELVGKILT